MGKFRRSAKNSAFCEKLWSLGITSLGLMQQVFTGWMPLLLPNQSTEEYRCYGHHKSIHKHLTLHIVLTHILFVFHLLSLTSVGYSSSMTF